MFSTSQQNVENLTASFDYLQPPSFDKKTSWMNKHQNPKCTVGAPRGTPEPSVINDDKAVMKEEAVRCISCEKDHPACDSLSRNSKRYKPQNPNYSIGGAPGGTQEPQEPRVINKEPVHCFNCGKDHPTYAFCCPYTPCRICFKTGHSCFDCPYLRNIPKGAEFDRANYEIFCRCGYLFNVDKWVCIECASSLHPLLKKKYCNICSKFTQHSSFECPKDKVRAAACASLRNRLLSSSQRHSSAVQW